jgi:hypothetical protein
VRNHLLPSFFSTASATPTAVDNAFFEPASYLGNTSTPIGEIPLAAAANLLPTLQAALRPYDDPNLCAGTVGERIFQMIATKSQNFGAAPIDNNSYTNAQQESLIWGLPSLEELEFALRGTFGGNTLAATRTDFYNGLHEVVAAKPDPQTWDPPALLLTNPPPSAVSTYPPVAFWLTFGVIKKAFLNDANNWNIQNPTSKSFGVWVQDASTSVSSLWKRIVVDEAGIWGPDPGSTFTTSQLQANWVNDMRSTTFLAQQIRLLKGCSAAACPCTTVASPLLAAGQCKESPDFQC